MELDIDEAIDDVFNFDGCACVKKGKQFGEYGGCMLKQGKDGEYNKLSQPTPKNKTCLKCPSRDMAEFAANLKSDKPPKRINFKKAVASVINEIDDLTS